jgi:hypothetical protein
MVPVETSSPAERRHKAAEIHRLHRVAERLAFVHVNLLDNRSEFLAPLRVEDWRAGGTR